MTTTGIRRLSENEWSSPRTAGQTSGRHWSDDMSETNSMGVNPDETVEPSGKTIHNARWRFEWRNLKNNRRFPL